MIRSVKVEALESGKSVDLILSNPEASLGFAITGIDGLGPGTATLNDSEWVTVDGSHENSVRLPARVITINLRFVTTELYESVADVRRRTYDYFPIKKKVRLTFEFADFRVMQTVRHRWIEGTVKQNDTGPFSEEEGAVIQVHCSDPYFKDTEIVEEKLSQIREVFHFNFPDEYMSENCELFNMPPVSTETETTNFIVSEYMQLRERDITNPSALDVGGIFKLEAFGNVKNPAIYNATTREVFELDYNMSAGEVITIDTRQGHKKVYINDGYETSLLQYLHTNSKWLHLGAGLNTIGYDATLGAENLFLSFTMTPIYEGV